MSNDSFNGWRLLSFNDNIVYQCLTKTYFLKEMDSLMRPQEVTHTHTKNENPIMELNVKTIYDLPIDIIYHIIKNYLDIDDSLCFEEALGKERYHGCFDSYKKLFSNYKSLGIVNLRWPNHLNEIDGNDEFQLLSVRYDLFDCWQCSNDEHIPSIHFNSNISLLREFNSGGGNEILLIHVLKLFPKLESLDLRGVRVTTIIIKALIRYCSRLSCIKMNYANIDPEALTIFCHYIAPKLIHLSCDNFFTRKITCILFGYEIFFINLFDNLIELEFILFPHGDAERIRFSQLESLSFLSFQIYLSLNKEIDNRILSDSLDTAPSTLRYLKIKSNCQINSATMMRTLRSLNNLEAINISCNLVAYQHHANNNESILWPNLESLTLDLYDNMRANRMIHDFIDRDEIEAKLHSLRLMSFTMTGNIIETIQTRAKCLTCLQLIDVKMKNIPKIFHHLLQMIQLEYLRIEYTFQADYPRLIDIDDYKHLKHYFAIAKNKKFKESIQSIRDFIIHHNRINKFILIHWPNLKYYHFKNVLTIIKEKNIKFFMLQC